MTLPLEGNVGNTGATRDGRKEDAHAIYVHRPVYLKAMKTPSMFVDHDASRTGKGKHLGYWTTSQVNDPYHLPWPGDFVDPDWDPAERAAVASYLDAQPDVQHWRGFSFCRLGCGMVPGCTDKSDGVYVWPAGFSHYLRAHNVKPPQEFIDQALGRAKQTKVAHPKFSLPGIYPLPDWVVEGGRAKVISEHGTLPVGTVVTVHSFADENVNIELADGSFFHYLRLDFAGLFGPVSA